MLRPAQHFQDAALFHHADAHESSQRRWRRHRSASSAGCPGHRDGSDVAGIDVESLHGVIEPMFLERFEILELHPADFAAEGLLAGQTGRVILLLVFGECRQVLVALAALLALVGFLPRAQRETDADVRFNQRDGRRKRETGSRHGSRRGGR